MATPTFYYPELTTNDSKIELSEYESRHALKSRRLGKGSPIQLINGEGLVAKGLICETHKRTVTIQINDSQKHIKAQSVGIAAAIPKGDRQRTMIDMLTQLGASEVFPLECERSVTHYKSSMLNKWQRWSIEACKQSQNPWLPKVHAGINLEQVLALPDFNFVYADALGRPMVSQYGSELAQETKHLLILIGPEGGFSQTEQELLRDNNCVAVNLGQTVLRTELAAVVALTQAFVKDN